MGRGRRRRGTVVSTVKVHSDNAVHGEVSMLAKGCYSRGALDTALKDKAFRQLPLLLSWIGF